MTGQSVPVIAVLADDDESAGSAFASKIIALGKQTDGVKAFSMFYSPSFEKNVDDLSKASLVYLMDRKSIMTEISRNKFLQIIKRNIAKHHPNMPLSVLM